MASATVAAGAASEPPPASGATTTTNPVDESLWWDSFVALAEELDRAPLSGEDADIPNHLVEKLKKNRGWFLGSVTGFRPPNETSRLALDSSQVAIGSRRLVVTPQLKEAALRVSKCLCLDEVQSVILISRSAEFYEPVAGIEDKDFLHSILLQYFLERQCLLQCTRRIFVNAYTSDASHSTKAFKTEASQLVQDGLEYKLLSLFEDLLLSIYCDKSDVEFIVLWMEEVLIEVNLVLDIFFLVYYDSLFNCNSKQWKALCLLFKNMLCGSLNLEKVAVSNEAISSFCQARAKLLLILIETLDLENLLQMVRDEIPFRQGCSVYSSKDIHEIDGEISSFIDSEAAEAGPLVLAWAVFLSLMLSIPEANNSLMLMEIDHTSYVRQAFELRAFDYLLETLGSDSFRDTDGPISGFLSIIRTLISAFTASYELSYQIEDSTFVKVLDIICKIYNGEESLSTQFWDKESFVDGPIRSILFTLEKEYPFNMAEFLRLLSALCEGKWPAECVYNYLDKMSGITMLFEIPGGSDSLKVYDIIENHCQLKVSGVEGLVIPSRTRGYVLKVIDANLALVRWECAHSGVLLLLLRLAEFHSDDKKDVSIILNLLYRLISFNKGLCFRLLRSNKLLPMQLYEASRQMDTIMSVDVVQVICNLIFKLVPDVSNARTMSMCFDILAGMLHCSPSHVIDVLINSNIVTAETNGTSRVVWMLSGGLARMLMHDFGDLEDSLSLATSVLNFTTQLLEKGADDCLVSPLVIFCLQYVFVNYMHWKVKSEFSCWKMAIKVFEVLKSCFKPARVSIELGFMIRNILLHDSSVYNTFCLILCISAEELRSNASHICKLKEIECLQLLACSAFDVVHSLLADLSQESLSGVPAFFRTMFLPSTKPMPAVTAAVSLISFLENSEVQMAAARALSSLCFIASRLQLYTGESFSPFVNAIQMKELQMTIYHILDKEANRNEELVVAILNLLTSIAYFQPAFLTSLILSEEQVEIPSKYSVNMEKQLVAAPSKPSSSVEAVLKYVEESEILVHRSPNLVLSILNLLKAIWEGGIQYKNILEKFRSSKNFWDCLSSFVISTQAEDRLFENNFTNSEIQFSSRYLCQGKVLEIVAHELFLQEKQLQSEVTVKQSFNAFKGQIGLKGAMSEKYAQNVLLRWFNDHVMENLLKSYSEVGKEREVIHRAKLAVSACIVHLMAELGNGNTGGLSISLVKKILLTYNKLTAHPAFAVLLSQYALRGYSEKKEPTKLIISDLYYHIQGELEGREIVLGPFKELSCFLLGLEPFKCNEKKDKRDLWISQNNFFIFDIPCLRKELGTEFWDQMDWKANIDVADRMFFYMHEANLAGKIIESKHTAMKALISLISIYKENVRTKQPTSNDRDIPESFTESCIQSLCIGLQKIIDSLKPVAKITEALLRTFANQEAFLLILSRILSGQSSQDIQKKKFFPLYMLIIRTSDSAIKVFAEVRPSSPAAREVVKLLLKLLLTSYDFCYHKIHANSTSDPEVKLLAEASLISVGLLPVLCKYSQDTEYCNLSVATMNVVLKGFLTPATWLPILRKHLSLQLILQKFQEKDSSVSILIILNFLLTLGHTKGGAEMLYSAKFFNSLKLLFSQSPNGMKFSSITGGNDLTSIVNNEEDLHLWVVSLAIITSVIYSLGDDYSYTDLVVSVMRYFFSEKAYMMFFCLSALDFTADNISKKRARVPNSQTSFTRLKLTECTLALICVLARNRALWNRGVGEMNSELREHVIHLLAFISKGSHRTVDGPNRPSPLFCHPSMKEEVELHGRPSFITSKNGWFAVRTVDLPARTVASSSDTSLSVVLKDKGNENAAQTHLSDIIAISIYRVSFFLLMFLCMEAKAAAKRAEEVEFIDLVHFPELPTPEILHGLQDQAIAIVLELCGSSRSKALDLETQSICHLLLQILEKSLYLELSVYQSCGIRPVLGRLEDFSREIKKLLQVLEQHTKFKIEVSSLKQIISLVYPGMLQATDIIKM